MDNPFVAQAALALLADNPRDALRIARMGLSLCNDEPALLEIAADSASQLDQDTDAARYWQRLGELVPDHSQAWNGLGIALQRLGAVDEAEAAWRRALALLPDDANLHTNLGLLLAERGALAEAEQHQRRAVALAPDSAPILTNLGDLLAHDSPEEALASYHTALVHDAGFATAHCNLGVLLADQGQATAAEAAFRQALALRPDFPQCRVNLAQLLLRQGRFDEGWALHESRLALAWRRGEVPAPHTTPPQWQGESLRGRSIIVLPEQGYGDDIQFCRYVPWLKSLGAARVTLACRPGLTALMHTLAGADQVIDADEGQAQLPQHDYWTVALSLPLRAGTTWDSIPAPVPYLHPDPARQRRLQALLEADAPAGTLRVGLVWRGNPRHANDRARSLPGLATLAPLWAVPGVHFFSVQKPSPASLAVAPPPGQPLVDLAPQLGDFADTAALIAGLDLVISVDTAVAHLAGALGRRCWVLLPARKADWRWPEGRTDSPWYPDLRLFRQTRHDDWSAVVASVAKALEELRAK